MSVFFLFRHTPLLAKYTNAADCVHVQSEDVLAHLRLENKYGEQELAPLVRLTCRDPSEM